ncbi:septum site-determining protein MinC [Marinobacterium arenosum]|uniref:septum site-determining protein MinC n=1 Tax=Marinobacterium arenosum TaxID=2862496 RepID=UPI001C9492F6|nr:septum site-determining protein MinC [Marinobacterium arenosum]MBY4678453.1 septum site-determining protein MinC [Marinobacterium arenosum]
MSDLSFQLKGSVVSIIILELYQFTPAGFADQLRAKIDQAPQFFAQSPVVISLEKLNAPLADDEPSQLLALCREFGLQPMAFRGGEVNDAIRACGLPQLPSSSRADSELQMPAPVAPAPQQAAPEVVVKTVVEERVVQRPAKIIERPVRSGQQVYAEGADLIILSQVSEGAEVIADGNIHIYGPLRGRALAGVKGDQQARIFCQHMAAELVSIAGNFMLSDSLRKQLWQQPAQVALNGDSLHLKTL